MQNLPVSIKLLINKIYNECDNINQIRNLIEKKIITSNNELFSNAEVSTPFKLIDNILNNIDDVFWDRRPKILDHSCGKGNIIIGVFDYYYKKLIKKMLCPVKVCKDIIENKLYFCDINPNNVFITQYLLTKHAGFYTKKNIKYNFNTFIGNSLELDCQKHFNIGKFDGIIVNPPFEDKEKRGRTQHKLWIDFTKKVFNDLLIEGGILAQISPFSFASPSSKILTIFKNKIVKHIFFNQEKYFPKVNTSICWYIIENSEYNNNITSINNKYKTKIDKDTLYIPNDFCEESINIHRKVMFSSKNKLKVEKDYVTAHNINLKKNNSTLSKVKTNKHIYPVFHTNRQIWYSSILQPFANKNKVMWTRSGYTKPFFDEGKMGVTDMGYYIIVPNKDAGENLESNLKSKLFFYIFKTAKWSGFGNEIVFSNIPVLLNKKMSDDELYSFFKLSEGEISYINHVT